MSITKNSFINSIFTLLSQFSGFIRDIFLASFLGTGIFSNIFIIALKLPMSFQRSFSGETFNSAFIPTLNSIDGDGKKYERMQLAKTILLISCLIVVPIIIIVEINMPRLLSIISPGLMDNPEFNILVKASRITFIYISYIILSSVLIGLLNFRSKFSITASMPIIVNLGIIFATFFFQNLNNADKVIMLSWSFIVGGILQLSLLLSVTNRDFWSISFNFKRGFNHTKKFFNLILPTFFSSILVQVNIIFGIFFASFFHGAVSYIYFADRVFMFPVMLTGTSIAIVLIPTLSKKIREKKNDDALKSQNMAFKLVVATSIAAAVILILLNKEIVQFLFERGEFNKISTINTSKTLVLLSLSLPFVCLSGILRPYFFAIKAPSIPLKITVISVMLNITLTMILIWRIGYIAIPIAISIASILNAYLYYQAHKHKKFFIISTQLGRFLRKYIFFNIIIISEILLLKLLLNRLDFDHSQILAICTVVILFSYILLISKFDNRFIIEIRSLLKLKTI